MYDVTVGYLQMLVKQKHATKLLSTSICMERIYIIIHQMRERGVVRVCNMYVLCIMYGGGGLLHLKYACEIMRCGQVM